ncbi:c-type cytochrome [Falsiroseomonas sp. CW058]|uniref:c-type cytochrome n=1 Tax=Falsiroseomonas sp. CW058 TaxID=3388664 RepID=UPI003D322BE8
MRMHEGCLLALAFVAVAALPADAQRRFGFGTPATEAEIRGWDIDVAPDGSGLPEGRGSVREGAAIFAEQCASCHGEAGQGGQMDRLAGGQGSLTAARPIRTIGSFWPHATTIYDYVNRAMPFNAPQSLAPDQVYAVTAYLLNINGILPGDAVLDARSLPAVRMPNAGGFTGPDPRPDIANTACERNCGGR